jgi:hypothetical protein
MLPCGGHVEDRSPLELGPHTFRYEDKRVFPCCVAWRRRTLTIAAAQFADSQGISSGETLARVATPSRATIVATARPSQPWPAWIRRRLPLLTGVSAPTYERQMDGEQAHAEPGADDLSPLQR